MSAYDADDLLERAARALDRDIPTISEVTAELAAALDQLEREFPDGKPGRDATGSVRLRYMTLTGTVRHCRWQLENGQAVEFPRGRRSWLEQDESGESWEEFLAEHPELAQSGDALQEQEHPAPPLTFTDTELMQALRDANRSWDRRRPKERRAGGVYSSSVANELSGVSFVPGEGLVPTERRPSKRDVIRVGLALARLVREGRVERTNRRWESNRWAPAKRRGRDDG